MNIWYKPPRGPHQEQSEDNRPICSVQGNEWPVPILVFSNWAITSLTGLLLFKSLVCAGITSFLPVLILFWPPDELVSAAAGSWERPCPSPRGCFSHRKECATVSSWPGGLCVRLPWPLPSVPKDKAHVRCEISLEIEHVWLQPWITTWGLGPALFFHVVSPHRWNGASLEPTGQGVPYHREINTPMLKTSSTGPTSKMVASWRETVIILFYRKNNNRKQITDMVLPPYDPFMARHFVFSSQVVWLCEHFSMLLCGLSD